MYLRSLLNNNPNLAADNVQLLAKSPDWQVWFAHNTSEINETTLRAMLDEIKKQEAAGKLEVVTYREMYSEQALWEETVNLGSTKYTIDFYSTDNKTLLSSVVVECGKTATAPEIDLADGVKFKGWSGPITNITKNCSVYAICDGIKTTDDPAVGLKHEHFFIEFDTTQTCGLCGLVTAIKTQNNTSSNISASSTTEPGKSEESVPEESAPSTDGLSSLDDTTSKNDGGINLIVIISAVALAIVLGGVSLLIFKKRNKK